MVMPAAQSCLPFDDSKMKMKISDLKGYQTSPSSTTCEAISSWTIKEPTDEDLLVVCCCCGSGPRAQSLDPACLNCGHEACGCCDLSEAI
ncbi:hypothetical protein E6O75_ATG04666 [Venturia nashicola]|uniref:Uncharacterized protein n=1 Tax=Venturia nashicola TaxID=86259 RepID=A0A4Z1P8N9_9PEZI|nr:hypothetical protein E6O75_ATG04666 [Venturia nashicola]